MNKLQPAAKILESVNKLHSKIETNEYKDYNNESRKVVWF